MIPRTFGQGTAPLEPWASRFILELFSPHRRLLSHDEGLLAVASPSVGPPEGTILILDLNGHFTTCVGLRVGGEPYTVMINTTAGSYLTAGAPTVAFDMVFQGGEEMDVFVPTIQAVALEAGGPAH